MKKSILLVASLSAIFGAVSCNNSRGQLPKSLSVSSPNSDVVVTSQYMNDFGLYFVTVKCNTPNMYFREGIYYYEDYQVKIGGGEKKPWIINKRISLNEIEFKFNDTEIGGKDIEIEVTPQNAIKTFDQFNFTGKISGNPPLEVSPFTISVFDESTTFNIIKKSNVDESSVWEINISCSSQLYFYGSFNPSTFTGKDWNDKYEINDSISITFKWSSSNSDFETHAITFDGYGPPIN